MVLESVTQEGIKVYVGQTDMENDALRKAASQNYIWFHLRDNPSPHVILACPISEAGRESIRQAALLCKRYSKREFRDSRSAKVIYTELKNVKNDPKKHGSCQLAKSPEVITVWEANEDDQVVLNGVKKSHVI